MKRYHLMFNVGTVKYLVCFHNGTDFYPDGSPFFHIQSFSNKKNLKCFIDTLNKEGFSETGFYN